MLDALALFFLALLMAAKIAAAYKYRFNTDEPQHLHVLWGWVHGRVQYRDLFDNHPPLFHLVMAPLFALFRERADIVVPMRLTMAPFYLASLLAIYRLGRALYTSAVAPWVALAAGALPQYFFPATEFRPDNVYSTLWLWTLVLTVERPWTLRRLFGIGLLLGACVTLTLKTSMLLASLAMAGCICCALCYWKARKIPPLTRIPGHWIALGIGAAIFPAGIAAFFAAHHSLGALCYCVFRHNIVPHVERWGGSPLHYFYLPIGLPAAALYAFWVMRASPDGETGLKRAFITILPLIYYLLLYSFWPDITSHDDLPGMPLLPLALMPLLMLLPWDYARAGAMAALFLSASAILWRTQVLQRGNVTKYVAPIDAVLHLAGPGDYVMDLKGDCIYRDRPFFPAIETFTKARLKLGWMQNNILPRMIATQTKVCFHPPFPGEAVRKFLDRYYLPLAAYPNILVAGQRLGLPHDAPVSFDVAIPAEYVILQGGKEAAGTLDALPYTGARALATGAHQFTPEDRSRPLLLYWARALSLGYPAKIQ